MSEVNEVRAITTPNIEDALLVETELADPEGNASRRGIAVSDPCVHTHRVRGQSEFRVITAAQSDTAQTDRVEVLNALQVMPMRKGSLVPQVRPL
jgi:hypothetical protein